MAYPVDPMRTKYWPEIFGEAGIVANSVDGTEIATYSNYHDYIVQLVSLATTPEATDHSAIRVNSDAGTNLLNSTTEARYYADKHEDLKVTGVESLALFCHAPASTPSNVQYQYGLRITKPTVYEKLLLKMALSDEEEAINAKFSIQKKIDAGVLAGQTAQQFTKIYEVAKRFTSAVDVNPTVGSEIHPLPGQKVVLLGISVDYWATANQVFVNVTRDGEQVIKLDAHAFVDAVDATYNAEMNYELPLHVVATDNLRVWVENTASIAAGLNVRYRYGIAPLTIIEKIRWGLVLSDEEKSISAEFDLEDSVIAGVA